MANKQKAILGNHEHMMLDYYKQNTEANYHRYYGSNVWGGLETLHSYNPEFGKRFLDIKEVIPMTHIEYLKSLPLYIETDKLLLSHGPKDGNRTLEECTNLGTGFWGRYHTPIEAHSIIWNRLTPTPYKNKIQIFGHNNEHNVKEYTKKNPKGTLIVADIIKKTGLFALCIDTSNRGGFLTAIHYPTLQLYRQEFID